MPDFQYDGKQFECAESLQSFQILELFIEWNTYERISKSCKNHAHPSYSIFPLRNGYCPVGLSWISVLEKCGVKMVPFMSTEEFLLEGSTKGLAEFFRELTEGWRQTAPFPDGTVVEPPLVMPLTGELAEVTTTVDVGSNPFDSLVKFKLFFRLTLLESVSDGTIGWKVPLTFSPDSTSWKYHIK